MTNAEKKTSDDAQAACRVIQSYYRQSVKGSARCILERVLSGELGSDEDLGVAVNECVNDSRFVTHYWDQDLCLIATEHEHDVDDQGGEFPLWGDHKTAACAAAFEGDLRDSLQHQVESPELYGWEGEGLARLDAMDGELSYEN